jgi:hypothetical protein
MRSPTRVETPPQRRSPYRDRTTPNRINNQQETHVNFFKSIKTWFGKLFVKQDNGQSVIVNDMHIAAGAVQVLAPGIVLVLSSIDQNDASAEAVTVSHEVVTDLGVLSSLLAQAQQNPTDPTLKSQISATLDSIQSNFAVLLDASHVKNPDTRAKITNVANAFIAEAKVIVGFLK